MHDQGAVETLINMLDVDAAAEEAAGALKTVLTWFVEEEVAAGVRSVLAAFDVRRSVPSEQFAELAALLEDAADLYGDEH